MRLLKRCVELYRIFFIELKKGGRLLLNGLYVSNDDKTENAAWQTHNHRQR